MGLRILYEQQKPRSVCTCEQADKGNCSFPRERRTTTEINCDNNNDPDYNAQTLTPTCASAVRLCIHAVFERCGAHGNPDQSVLAGNSDQSMLAVKM